MSNTIKLYPGWKEAAMQIAKRVSEKGYELFLSFDELYELMDIKQPSQTQSINQWKMHSFEWLQHIENLKKILLEEYNICLFNVRGEGYRVLHPNEQIMEAVPKRMKKAMQTINKAVLELTHVNQELLSYDAQQNQFRNMERISFVKAALSKRRKITADDNEKNMIENK